MTDEVDFAAEGLLDGLEGPAREGRRTLLARLLGEGIGLGELRRAVAEDRLALLPVERLLGTEPSYTARELAQRSGVDRDTLVAALTAFGQPAPEPDDRRFGEADLAAARRLRESLDHGLPAEGLIDANRVIGRSMAQVAAVMRQLVGATYLHVGDTEDELAARYENAARELLPALAPTLEHAFSLHLREQLRGDAIDAAALRSGALTTTQPLAVAFADLVGFTSLGGQVAPDELGRVARRLEQLAAAAVRPPVRLIKVIGDAVLLVSADPAALVRTLLDLVDAADAEGDGFPQLRAGVALGETQERDGDVYGQPVNLASRLTAIARPGSVLADTAVREALRDDFAWSFAGERRIKGLAGEQRVFRARTAQAG